VPAVQAVNTAALVPESVLAARPFAELISTAAAAHDVDARLVHAVIEQESNYQARARSKKGARGLMQLMPATARQYGVRNSYDPKANIEAGVKHLKSLLSRLELPIALAAYNAGEGTVQRYGGLPPFPETQSYVSSILRRIGR
jgi:soluble lytic murein transglycosylase-like protein